MKSQLKKIAALFLSLCVALSVMTVASFADTSSTSYYEKVTTAPEDWSGDYLIVYEKSATEATVFNGGAATLDAEKNHIAGTIADGKIEATDAMNAAKVTITKKTGGYSLKAANGKYFGNTSDQNKLVNGTSDTYTNTITLDANGNADIVSANSHLRFNSATTANNNRFRYYKSATYTGQKAIALYKLVEVAGGDDDQQGGTTTPPAGGDDDQGGTTTPPATTPTYNVVDTPVAGTAYKFGMVQENLNNALYYITGVKGGYNNIYLATTTDVTAAADVFLEETTGGYYLYTNASGAKKYINMVVSGTYVNGEVQDTASTVYTYDATAKTIIATVNDAPYWFGTRNDKTYDTVGPVKTEYNGFYCKFYAADTTVTPPAGDDDDDQGGTTPTPTPTEPADGSTLTIPEAIALATPKAKNEYTTNKFMVTGKVVAISSTQYGNLYIADEAGNELYVYGVKGKDGTYFDKLDPKVEVGDTVTLYGPVGKYNDVQMKETVLENLVKGQGETTNTDPKADSVLTVKEAIDLGLSKRHDTYTAGKYYVTGTITEIYNEQYGNMKIADKDGNILTLYGTFDENGTGYAEMTDKPAVGDEITIYGIIGQYNGTAQIKNGTFKAAPNEDEENIGNDDNNNNENEDNKNDGNEDEEGKVEAPDAGDHTSIAFAVIMMLLAAAAFVASKKRV